MSDRRMHLRLLTSDQNKIWRSIASNFGLYDTDLNRSSSVGAEPDGRVCERHERAAVVAGTAQQCVARTS